MFLKMLGFIWPPLGWKLRLQEFNAADRAAYCKWYAECYIPFLKRDAERRLEEYKQPMLFAKFIKPVANVKVRGCGDGTEK